MNRPKTNIVAAGLCLAVALAAASSALAWWDPSRGPEVYKSYEEGCNRWSSQGAGQRIKCFSCLKRQEIDGKEMWINTCSHPAY